MRSRLAWFLGGLGFAAAIARFLRSEPARAPSLPPPTPGHAPVPSTEHEPWLEGEPGPQAQGEAQSQPEPVLEPEPEPEAAVPAPGGEPEHEAEPAVDPRAEELRRRLDESRTLVGERDEFESGETTVDDAVATQATPGPDERRRHVHERGQATIERMHRDGD